MLYETSRKQHIPYKLFGGDSFNADFLLLSVGGDSFQAVIGHYEQPFQYFVSIKCQETLVLHYCFPSW